MASSAPERRPGLARHLAAIGMLPTMAAGVVPAILVVRSGADPGFGTDGLALAAVLQLGFISLAAGLALAVRTIALFDSAGEGTLAPWDPTSKLVIAGPYRHVRNPMITGVALVLAGEAAILGSVSIALWLGIFAAVNAIYMPLSEERGLRRRFGEDYDAYRRNVPRWVPRRTPWTPERSE